MTRIMSLDSTPMQIIVTLAEGNPGAADVMAQMFTKTPEIDPDNALGGLGPVLFLDTLGIYGSRIWSLYKNVCGQRIDKTLAVLRAVQMGKAKQSDLSAAIDGRAQFDVDGAVTAVREQLPAFNVAA